MGFLWFDLDVSCVPDASYFKFLIIGMFLDNFFFYWELLAGLPSLANLKSNKSLIAQLNNFPWNFQEIFIDKFTIFARGKTLTL